MLLFPPEATATSRFVIRGYQPGDGAALHEATSSSYEHLKRFMPWARADQTLQESEALVRGFAGKWLLTEDFVLGIWSARRPDRLLGGTGFHLRAGGLELRNAEIGMWIRESEAGKGLGTEVLRELLRWGFTEWPWERLSWRCSDANVASQKVAAKAGMKLEGVLRSNAVDPDGRRRDTWLYAMLKDEWTG